MAGLVRDEIKSAMQAEGAGIGESKKGAMETETRYCRLCGEEIPKERVEMIPGTLVCVKCSQKIGGEFKLKVRFGSSGKAGSLKKTGQELSVELVEKELKWPQRNRRPQ
jgi:hypothetical protein